ncbi:MAG: hypothetical protein HY928_16225 [Elusimicrobia bacterium]|nr:hypothetical protein [Elusimicrobiota bacterium]
MPSNDFGYSPTDDYSAPIQSALARLRSGQARQRNVLAEATRRVRTSGARFIPAETLERGFSEAEAGVYGDFALDQARTGIEDRRREEDFQRQLQLMDRSQSLQDALARRQGSDSLKSSLISGGLGALGTIYAGPLGGAAASTLYKRQ